MFGLPRHIAVFSDSLERDERLPAKFQGVDLKGKFVGVVDLEPIGADVARLGAGMGVNVLGLAWTETPGRAQHGLRLLSLDALFAGADVGTLHLTLNHHTERFIFRPL
jgi:D-3-phosphoglycerate dehydrogenase